MSSFSDSKAISGYAENAIRRVPGLKDIHRMSALLMAERTPPSGRVLIVGAGGGMELSYFAETFPDWKFDGVDPSREMLDLAKTNLGSLASRVQLHCGYIEAAPEELFDAASCLLTLHFTNEAERYRTLCEIHARLKPGGVLVTAHTAFLKILLSASFGYPDALSLQSCLELVLSKQKPRWQQSESSYLFLRRSRMKNSCKRLVSLTSTLFMWGWGFEGGWPMPNMSSRCLTSAPTALTACA